jgi:phosphoglucosamine mutase
MVLSSAVSGNTSLRSSQAAAAQVGLGASHWETLNLPSLRLFGTDGIRGKAGELLTAPLALQVGYWAGKVLRSQSVTQSSNRYTIILGQDSRNSSHMLAMALSAGLTAAGMEVWNLGLCPTPTVAYLTHSTQAAGGVMISASHNPPEDNGIKFFGAGGAKLSTELQQAIELALRGENRPAADVDDRWGQSYYRPELVAAYVESLHRPLLPTVNLEGMKIVLDLAWGAATQVAPIAFEQMGAKVICLHDYADGDRINVNCGSTHLEPLIAGVRNHRADLGFAFDGDADRVMAVDAQGRVVDGDYILYFWGQALRQANQLPENLIVSTVMANLGFERAWENLGGTLIRTAVGDQHVHAEMLKRGAKLGGEQSGHILCPHYGVSGDGLLTALHLTSLVRQSGASLVDLMDQSFQTYPQLLRNVRVEDRERRLNWQQDDRLIEAVAQAEAAMGDQGRVLVRASGTEPVIRVMVEAASVELTDYWTETLMLAVQRYAA